MTTQQEERTKEEDELVIGADKMNKAQRQAMEIAEAAREQEFSQPSFVRQLFLGHADFDMMAPFPEQSDEERAIGDRLCDEVEEFLLENLDPDEVDATRTIPDAVVKGLAKMKLFAMKVPKEYGGLGLTQVNYNRVMALVSSFCSSTAVLLSAHQSIGVPEPLKLFGTPEQKQKFFPRFAEGAISAFALTEPDVGSDPAQMAMTAELSEDGSEYILNGKKLWCTNGPIADILVVMAVTKPKIVGGKERKQISALIVEGNSPGIEVVHRCDFMGIRGIQNGLLSFTNVRVPAENLLDKEGRGLALALKTLNTGRLTIPAACVGGAKQLLKVARTWGMERKQWGQPIGLHEAGREKIADIASSTFALEAVTWLTSHWADEKAFDIRIEAAIAKYFASETLWRLVDKTLQLRGGRGYETGPSLRARGEKGVPIERMMRDTRINMIIEGTSEVMRLILAREALDPHLSVAGPILKKSTSFMGKIAAGVRALGFYGTWYPVQWVNSSWWASHSDKGELAKWFQFIDHTAHHLSRTIFHKMLRFGPSLEKRQMVLGHLVDIAVELFAMASTCSYALSKKGTVRGDSPVALAEHFCTVAKRRIEAHFTALSQGDDKVANALAARVTEGEMSWLEEGVVESKD